MSTVCKKGSPAFNAKKEELKDTYKKFQRACGQLSLLNKRLKDLKVRYEQALNNKNKYSLQNLRTRISVTDGVRSMFYEYVYTRAEDVAMLKHDIKFWKENDDVISGDDSEVDSDAE